jgi:hypothetical protein
LEKEMLAQHLQKWKFSKIETIPKMDRPLQLVVVIDRHIVKRTRSNLVYKTYGIPEKMAEQICCPSCELLHSDANTLQETTTTHVFFSCD